MVVERDRQGRQQLHHDIGDKGRMTGVRAPKNVPRDSQGNEDPNAFFNSRESGASTLGRPSFGGLSQSQSQSQADRRLSQPNRPRYSQSPVKAGGRNRERPDLYAQDGERGRKTGVTVPQQERDAEGFEDMSAFFDKSSPQTAKKSLRKPSAKKRVISPVQYDYSHYDNEDDDDGSREMDIDNNNSYSPSDVIRGANRSNGRLNQSTSSLRKANATATANSSRVRLSSSSATDDDSDTNEQVRLAMSTKGNGSSARNKAQSTSASRKSVGRRVASDEEDEDSDPPQVVERSEEEDQPTPKGRGGRATGAVKGRTSTGSNGVGSSRKGKERARSPEPGPVDDDQEDEPADNFQFDDDNNDYGGGDDGYDSGGQDGQVPFGDDPVEDDQDEDQPQTEEEDQEPAASKSKAKGKGKAKETSKTKAKTNGKGKSRDDSKTKAKVAKERAQPVASTSNGRKRLVNKPTLEPIIERKRPRDSDDEDDDGVRRSHRTRVEPVEYWRNERVIYKRRASAMGALQMDAVVKIPKGEIISLTNKKKGGRRGDSVKPTSRARSVKPEVYEDEDGIDDLTDPDGIVWSWEGNAETTRRIAFTSKMIDPRPTYNNKFMFQKVFTELDYLASGILQIPAGAEKPSKAARDNSYTFYCIEGAVSVVVHRSRFNIGPGGTFFVPRGNSYSITAVSNRDVKLFFTQARRVFEGPGGETRPDTQEEAVARLEAEQEEEEEVDDAEEEEEEEE